MDNIIPLHRDAHEQALRLLPWYANGTLDPAEAATVEAHLDACAECRGEFDSERALGSAVASLSIQAEQAWAAMRRRINAAAPSRSPPAPVRLLRRPIAVGWALAAQVAAALLIGILSISISQAPEGPPYRALGSARAASAGNVIVLFRPDATEREMRAALVLADARLVDGPTASGAYVLAVAEENRTAAVKRLQAIDQILLAERIDPDSGR